MITSKLNCYENFKCLASDCPDTCCAGWTVAIDDDSYAKYISENCDKEFSKKISKNLIKCRDGYCAKLKKNRCAFLTSDNLCELYINFGENSLSKVCKNHPRFINDYGALREINFSLSCPLACTLLLKEKDLKITTKEETFAITPNEIDPDLYFTLKTERELVFDVIKSDINFDDKIKELYHIANKNYIDFNTCIKDVLKTYLKCSYTRKELKSAIKQLINFNDARIEYDNSIAFNNLLFAYVFRFWTAPLLDKDALNIEFISASIAIISFINKNSNLGLEKIISLYSREIIHCDKNMQKINKLLKKLQ
jgi:lysine-N-methylase